MAKQPLFHNFRMVEDERSGEMFIKHSQTGSSQNQRGRLAHGRIDGLLQFLLRLVDLGGQSLDLTNSIHGNLSYEYVHLLCFNHDRQCDKSRCLRDWKHWSFCKVSGRWSGRAFEAPALSRHSSRMMTQYYITHHHTGIILHLLHMCTMPPKVTWLSAFSRWNPERFGDTQTSFTAKVLRRKLHVAAGPTSTGRMYSRHQHAAGNGWWASKASEACEASGWFRWFRL